MEEFKREAKSLMMRDKIVKYMDLIMVNDLRVISKAISKRQSEESLQELPQKHNQWDIQLMNG